MSSPAQEVTTPHHTVREEPRITPFKPPRYSFAFADQRDAFGIAALGGQYGVDLVHQSLAKGDDEWITARGGEDIVAALRIRAEDEGLWHTADVPLVAA